MHKLSFILLIIGGLNWGLTGVIRGWDLANFLGDSLTTIIYVLVGLSAIYQLFSRKGHSM